LRPLGIGAAVAHEVPVSRFSVQWVLTSARAASAPPKKWSVRPTIASAPPPRGAGSDGSDDHVFVEGEYFETAAVENVWPVPPLPSGYPPAK
jgi:hypothetical protein